MRFAITFLSLIYLSGQHGAYSGLSSAVPYKLKIVRFERCVDEGTAEYIFDLRTRKDTPSFLQGYASLPYDLDDKVHGEMNISRLDSNGMEKTTCHFKSRNACKNLFKIFPNFFGHVFKSWGIQDPSCPIKAGNYTVEMDTELPTLKNVPMLPYGHYTIVHALNYGDPPVRIGCTKWYFESYETPRS